MRISAFELDCKFRTHFTLAEVLNGQANAFQMIQIQNLRGDENSWLNLALFQDGRIVRRKSIRGLRVGDSERAARFAQEIISAMRLPANIAPGSHLLRLEITSEKEPREILSDVTVFPPNIIPTDFLRAPLLPAYVQEGDLLRNFAAGAIQHLENPDAATVVRCLYDALLAKKLMFQPVGGRQYPDCQRIASMSNVLHHGGCCVELSLLFASLLRNVGQSPALLLFGNHMAAGCFPQKPPAFDVLDSPEQILRLAQSGELLLLETTSVCHLHQHSFDAATREILQRLELCVTDQHPCMLINVRRILRPEFKLVPPDLVRMKCSNCHYITEVSLLDESPVCTACGTPFPAPGAPDDAAPPEPWGFSDAVQYALHQSGAAVLRLKPGSEDIIRVMDVWQGRSVLSISERAFARSGVRSVFLPDSLVQIGDYAFLGCKQLRHLTLPDTVTEIGTGAFRDSGLQEIRIPGGVKRISRLAFAGCGDLAIVTIPEGTQFIDEKAFDGCGKLRSVTIPASVRQVARSAFPPGCELFLMARTTKLL